MIFKKSVFFVFAVLRVSLASIFQSVVCCDALKTCMIFFVVFPPKFRQKSIPKARKTTLAAKNMKRVYECILVAVFSWKRRPWASKTCPKTSSKVPVGSFWEPFSDWKMAQGKKGIVHRRFRGASRHSERCSDASRPEFGANSSYFWCDFRIVVGVFLRHLYNYCPPVWDVVLDAFPYEG